MSEKIATAEKVADAIARIEKLGARPSADRVREITGGSKSTVLPLYKKVMERHMTIMKSDDENRASSPPQELQDAVQKACKAISAIPALFMDELSRYDRIIGHHSKEVLGRETAERDERILLLEVELEAARRGEQELRQRLHALEHELAWAKKYVAALEAGPDAAQAPPIARNHGPAAPAARQGTDYAEPFLIKITPDATASSNAPHRHHPALGDANDDW